MSIQAHVADVPTPAEPIDEFVAAGAEAHKRPTSRPQALIRARSLQ